MSYQSRKNNKKQFGNNFLDDTDDFEDNDEIEPASRKKLERQESSKKALKTAAKGAGNYIGGPVGGKIVDLASKTKTGQKVLNKGAETLNKMPGVGRVTHVLDKSGKIDEFDKGLDALSNNKGKNNVVGNGGGQNSSLPSSHSENNQDSDDSGLRKIAGVPKRRRAPSFWEDDSNTKKEPDNDDSGLVNKNATFSASMIIKVVVLGIIPFLFLLIVLFVVVSAVSGLLSEYEDAFGISQTVGEETGDLYFEAESQEQQDFYDRINNVKLSYQARGKVVDPLKIVAVYHILTANGAELEYKDMSERDISQIADLMFDGSSYSEEKFRENLIKYIIPEYLPNTLDEEREQLADDVFDYIDRYYSLIGSEPKNNNSSCASIGSCAYDIKGFYISGSGNVAKSMQISDLKVRLMECGSPYGNGTYGKAIDQDLVNFEDYVAGVAYAEVGPAANIEVLKAQMVVARSYALARPTAMNNALGKKLEQENGQWILQITSCVADQVFCNIDQGCSYMGGGDGQGGIVRSGHVAGAVRTMDPLPIDAPIRQAAAATQGEVLVNSQGYIIAAGFLSTEQNLFSSLASTGLNYKQILLQVYNQGSRNYGASDIQKASCNTGDSSNCSISTGDFAGWKQYEGPWIDVPVGTGGTIRSIGCLVTSVAMQIAKSGVQTTITDFNPGTFVEYLNSHGGFIGGNFVWATATQVAPNFVYQGQISVKGLSREQKLRKIIDLAGQEGVYVVAEVKGDSGQHWVAIDSINGDTINMMDPGSNSTDMWAEYNWANTSTLAYYRVG